MNDSDRDDTATNGRIVTEFTKLMLRVNVCWHIQAYVPGKIGWIYKGAKGTIAPGILPEGQRAPLH